jgi:hypothetical protein
MLIEADVGLPGPIQLDRLGDNPLPVLNPDRYPLRYESVTNLTASRREIDKADPGRIVSNCVYGCYMRKNRQNPSC